MKNNSELSFIMGIDPDIDKSGVAFGMGGKVVRLECMDLFELYDFFLENRSVIKKVYLEASWLIKKSNWHEDKNRNSLTRQKNAYDVGRNHSVGQQIEKALQRLNINYIAIKPYASKKNHEEFCRMTKWPVSVRTNQEKRDAGMLIQGHY